MQTINTYYYIVNNTVIYSVLQVCFKVSNGQHTKYNRAHTKYNLVLTKYNLVLTKYNLAKYNVVLSEVQCCNG